MRARERNGILKVQLSASDTFQWAHRRIGQGWPCSFLAGQTVEAEFNSYGELLALAINGGRGDQDCPGDEFTACIQDCLAQHPERSVRTHPAVESIYR